MNRHLKTFLTFVLVLAVLVGAYFVSVYLANRAKSHMPAAQTNTNNTQPKDTLEDTAPSQRAGFRVYTNLANNFTLEYPDNLIDGKEDFTYLPYVNTQIKTEANFVHEIDQEYCAPSGECKPITQDFGFGVAIVPTPIRQIKASPGTKATINKIGDHQVLSFSQGVEGEGMIYYFLELSTDKTIMLYQPYIDESINTAYKSNPQFMKFEKQKEAMKAIIESIKITK